MLFRWLLGAALICALAVSISQDPIAEAGKAATGATTSSMSDELYSLYEQNTLNGHREQCESFLSRDAKNKTTNRSDGCDRKKTPQLKRACRYKDQVNRYFETFYLYQGLHSVLTRPTVAFHGFAKFLRCEAERHFESARHFIDYKNSRGDVDTLHGIINLEKSQCTSRLFQQPTPSPANFICFALNRELEIRQQLEDMHLQLDEDPNAQDFLEKFMHAQTSRTAEMETLFNRLRPSLSLEDCLARGDATSSVVLEHLVDRELRSLD